MEDIILTLEMDGDPVTMVTLQWAEYLVFYKQRKEIISIPMCKVNQKTSNIMTISPHLGRVRQEDCEFKANPGYNIDDDEEQICVKGGIVCHSRSM